MAGTTVKVSVVPKFDDGITAVCELHPRTAADSAYVSGGVLLLPPRGAPYTVEFHLDPGDVELSFLDSDNGADAWSCKHGGCPDPGDRNHQFKDPTVDPGGKVLTVQAPPAAGKNALYYSLNFADGSRFDPIVVNG